MIEIEIFKVGDYGEKGNYSESDLDGIVKDYDPKLHEAPVTVDHKREGPAYGWVKGLKRVGEKLVAVIANMAEELAEAVRGKKYVKVSVEIYLKMKETGRPYLRAVSFLGAQIPEVKGLAAVELGENCGEWVELEESENGNSGKNGNDGNYEKGGEEEMAEQDAKIVEMNEKLKDEAAKRVEAETKLKAAEVKFAEEELKRRKESARIGAKAWVDEKVREGFVTPAARDAGLVELLTFAALLPEDDVITFGEGTKKRADEIIKGILSQVKVINFSEVAKPEAEKVTDVALFAEKAKACGVTVQQYRAAQEAVAPFSEDPDMTPENYIKANAEAFGKGK
jgi:hypothetical protein